MTHKQFKKDKQQRLQNRTKVDPALEKPVDADPDMVEKKFQEWRKSFVSQFAWNGGNVKIAA